jgi:hypothetical protein
MWQMIIKFILSEIFQAVSQAVRDARKFKKKKAEDKLLVKDALNEKDPKERAKRVRDLLDS